MLLCVRVRARSRVRACVVKKSRLQPLFLNYVSTAVWAGLSQTQLSHVSQICVCVNSQQENQQSGRWNSQVYNRHRRRGAPAA